jgi:hypothetical protein
MFIQLLGRVFITRPDVMLLPFSYYSTIHTWGVTEQLRLVDLRLDVHSQYMACIRTLSFQYCMSAYIRQVAELGTLQPLAA